MYTFDAIIKGNRLLYEYVRGSYLYNLQEENKSDVDSGGIFICDESDLFGEISFNKTISDATNDKIWREIGDFYRLLAKSNIYALEALFVPQKRIITPPHKILSPLFDNKEKFLTQEYVNHLIHFALAVLNTLKKKNAVTAPKECKPFGDNVFALTEKGGVKLSDFLMHNGLNPKYCSLAMIPNLNSCFFLYYDWGAAFQHNNITYDLLRESYKALYGVELFSSFKGKKKVAYPKLLSAIVGTYNIHSIRELKKWYDNNQTIRNYIGLDLDNNNIPSIICNDTSIRPLCVVTDNGQIFSKEKDIKTESKDQCANLPQKKYCEAKTIMNIVRWLNMAQESVNGEGFILKRTNDRQELLKIKHGEIADEQIIEMLEEKITTLQESLKTTSLIPSVDKGMIKEMLITARREFYKK